MTKQIEKRGNMKLLLNGGRLIMVFDQPVHSLTLNRQEAIDLSQAMFSLAQRIPIIYAEEPKKAN